MSSFKDFFSNAEWKFPFYPDWVINKPDRWPYQPEAELMDDSDAIESHIGDIENGYDTHERCLTKIHDDDDEDINQFSCCII